MIRLAASSVPDDGADGEPVPRWPIGRIRLERLVKESSILSRNKEVNRRIQRKLEFPAVFQAKDGRVRVTARAVVDRE